jgi:osmotically-inducible protein OsmY
MTPMPIISLALVAVLLAACDRQEVRDLPARAERQIERAIPAAEEAALTGKVKAALIAAPDVSGVDIGVDTKGNVVTLSGMVATESLRRRAEETARGVQGVEEVVNNLTVGTAK